MNTEDIKDAREKDIQEIKKLYHRENYMVFWHGGEIGDVYRNWDMLLLFKISKFSGYGSFMGAFKLNETEREDK